MNCKPAGVLMLPLVAACAAKTIPKELGDITPQDLQEAFEVPMELEDTTPQDLQEDFEESPSDQAALEVVPATGIAPENHVFLSVPMVAATSVGEDSPFALLEGGRWEADPGASWVKAHFYFAETVELSTVSLGYCGNEVPKQINAYFNFDERFSRLTWNEGTSRFEGQLKGPVEARSITLNFGAVSGVCVEDFRVSHGEAVSVDFATPERVAGRATASSTLAPVEAYEAMNLFDSRMEYAWSSDDAGEGVVLQFDFDEPQSFSGLWVWNGYQRSAMHCWKNARPMRIRFGNEDTGFVDLELEDSLGLQKLDFDREAPLEGSSFTLTILDSYSGKNYQDTVISELRFVDAETMRPVLIDPLGHTKAKAQRNLSSFREAGLDPLVDASFAGDIEEGVLEESDGVEFYGGRVVLRLRADGSFYYRGTSFSADYNTETETSSESYALGNYSVEGVEPGSSIKLRLFGLLRDFTEEMDMGMDCNGCGRDCSQTVDDSGMEASLFSDTVTISHVGEGMLRADNIDGTLQLGFRRALIQKEGK